jgi:hypothetical protein
MATMQAYLAMQHSPGANFGHANAEKGDPKITFTEYQKQQTSNVTDRGAHESKEFEEKYIGKMIKTVLRSHVCYQEVDRYTQCLVDQNLVHKDELWHAEVNQIKAQQRCGPAVEGYNKCMNRKENHEAVVATAVAAPQCKFVSKELVMCLERQPGADRDDLENCHRGYLTLLRCGLNHMWDDYWRAISKFDIEEEAIMYEASLKQKKGTGVENMMELKYIGTDRDPKQY